MTIDYDEASKTYDNTRGARDDLIEMMDREVHFSNATVVLDFGCGTGNYIHRIWSRYRARCRGMDASEGMLEKARMKGGDVEFRRGDHLDIPYEDGTCDFIYMTDVIHHVPDIDALFATLTRKIEIEWENMRRHGIT